MNENNVNQNEPINTQSEDNDVQAERTFTQEDVNRIVSERLAKERSKAEQSQQIQEDQRAAELTARENTVACKEFIMDNGYPKEMLDCLDTSDPEEFKKKAETLFNAFLEYQRRHLKPSPRFSGEQPFSDSLDAAFSRDVKHVPKGSIPR